MDFFDLFPPPRGEKTSSAPTEITQERIAASVELMAAITACQFFPEGSAARDRFKVLVQEMAGRFAKRHVA